MSAAAVRTRADGTAYLITRDGEQQVTVAGSGAGIAIVEGIDAGVEVQVLGGDTGGAPPQPAPGEGTESTGGP